MNGLVSSTMERRVVLVAVDPKMIDCYHAFAFRLVDSGLDGQTGHCLHSTTSNFKDNVLLERGKEVDVGGWRHCNYSLGKVSRF